MLSLFECVKWFGEPQLSIVRHAAKPNMSNSVLDIYVQGSKIKEVGIGNLPMGFQFGVNTKDGYYSDGLTPLNASYLKITDPQKTGDLRFYPFKMPLTKIARGDYNAGVRLLGTIRSAGVAKLQGELFGGLDNYGCGVRLNVSTPPIGGYKLDGSLGLKLSFHAE